VKGGKWIQTASRGEKKRQEGAGIESCGEGQKTGRAEEGGLNKGKNTKGQIGEGMGKQPRKSSNLVLQKQRMRHILRRGGVVTTQKTHHHLNVEKKRPEEGLACLGQP